MKKRLALILTSATCMLTACGRSVHYDYTWGEDSESASYYEENTEASEYSSKEEAEDETADSLFGVLRSKLKNDAKSYVDNYEDNNVEADESTEEYESKNEIENYGEGIESYMDFIAGNKLLYFSNCMQTYYDGELYDAASGYSIYQITDILMEIYDLEKEPVIKYAELDCGNDGVKEFAVMFENMNIYAPDDDSTLVYIIKNIDGRLQLCYYYQNWARSGSSINYYGYYTSSGSNGATNHGADAGYIDSNGKWNFIYHVETEMEISQLMINDALKKIPTVAEKKEYDGYIVMLTYNFDEILTSEDYETVERYYSFDVEDAEESVYDNLYTESIYKEIMDEAGVLIYSSDEIDDMIRNKEEALGIDSQIKDAPELDFTEL